MTKINPDESRFNITTTPSFHKKVKTRALKDGKTMSGLVNFLLHRYMDPEEEIFPKDMYVERKKK